ncbi:endophilin-A3b isoform X1 [Salminus brasiliensis]|uniref:endophilin-A3b isoform X1 n=1 Tax=Salminus brasiliensis TaxID=930266 RepID=UPI003B8324B0
MSVAGLKKQLHKASQLLNEKINGVEGTKLDEDFVKMEKKFEITQKLILDLVPKTTEYLQPNPAYRAKLSMLNTMSRIRGQVKTVGYPQTEGMLGDCMLRYGSELGIESAFGCALVDMGQALKQMAQVRDCLDVRVKHSFIDPLQILQDKDLKEIMYHLRKLEGRRLDFDYKKRRKGKIADSEIKQALEKFEESKELAERSMFNLIENDVEQVRQLLGLVDAALDYHRQSCLILENIRSSLQNRITDTSNRPKKEFISKSIASTICYTDIYGFSTCSSVRSSDTEITDALSEKNATPVAHTSNQTPLIPQTSEHPAYKQDCDSHLDQPCCRALFSFKPENQGELGFKEGDLIILTNQIDENWYEGLLSGESGFFPISYVKVLVPLPQ